MSDAGGGWAAHPEGGAPGPPLPAVAPGRIVALGGLCELGPPRPDREHTHSFEVSEFALIDDGRRVTLHRDRGFTIGGIRTTGVPGSVDPRGHLRAHDLVAVVLTTVLPDDDACPDPHPWEWLAGLARARGLDVTADDLRALPYEVVLSDDVRRWLAAQ